LLIHGATILIFHQLRRVNLVTLHAVPQELRLLTRQKRPDKHVIFIFRKVYEGAQPGGLLFLTFVALFSAQTKRAWHPGKHPKTGAINAPKVLYGSEPNSLGRMLPLAAPGSLVENVTSH
jgi:hypothetical protein